MSQGAVAGAKPLSRSRTRFWSFAILWTIGTFLFSLVAFADAAFNLGLSGNVIGYGFLLSVILVIASVLIAPFQLRHRLLAILLFVILIPVQLVLTGFLLAMIFGMDGVQ